jgi:hypothetical protein
MGVHGKFPGERPERIPFRVLELKKSESMGPMDLWAHGIHGTHLGPLAHGPGPGPGPLAVGGRSQVKFDVSHPERLYI